VTTDPSRASIGYGMNKRRAGDATLPDNDHAGLGASMLAHRFINVMISPQASTVEIGDRA
jgi:hypothetical protein